MLLGERLSRKRLLEVSTEAGGKVVRSSVSKPSRHAHDGGPKEAVGHKELCVNISV